MSFKWIFSNVKKGILQSAHYTLQWSATPGHIESNYLDQKLMLGLLPWLYNYTASPCQLTMKMHNTHTHTHTHTTVLLLFWNLSRTTRVSRYQKGKTRKVKTNLDLLEQEIVSGSGICWAIYKSASHPRQPRQHFISFIHSFISFL